MTFARAVVPLLYLVALFCTGAVLAFFQKTHNMHTRLLSRGASKTRGGLCGSLAMSIDSNSTPKKIFDVDTSLSHFSKFGLAAQGILLTGVAFSAKPSFAGGGPDVVVLGSGGKTGKLTVEKLVNQGYSVRPVYRGEPQKLQVDGPGNLLPAAQADVTKIDTLEGAISGASTVIFAASASRKGGNAQQVDYIGVENVAKECVRLKIPRLVVISSAAVTRPDSLGFKITNLFGGIMNYKLQGENAVREAYKGASNLQYVIIRPGGLLDGKAVGPGKVELNQGDTIAGEVNRADVADCVAAAAVSKSIPGNVIFEMYESGKSGPLQPEFPSKSGFERNGEVLGADYNKLFEGLKVDA